MMTYQELLYLTDRALFSSGCLLHQLRSRPVMDIPVEIQKELANIRLRADVARLDAEITAYRQILKLIMAITVQRSTSR